MTREEIVGAVRGSQRLTDETKYPKHKYGSLEKYGSDLTELARRGKLDSVIGRDDEIEECIRILFSKKNNPIIIGESRIAITAIVERLAQRIIQGDVPEHLLNSRVGYHDADMRTGKATHWQLTSLRAFWPAVQVFSGEIAADNLTNCEFFHLWKTYCVLPERYLLDHDMLHTAEKYCPLHPELVESTFYLYQVTKEQRNKPSAMAREECPGTTVYYRLQFESSCHMADVHIDHSCSNGEECVSR